MQGWEIADESREQAALPDEAALWQCSSKSVLELEPKPFQPYVGGTIQKPLGCGAGGHGDRVSSQSACLVDRPHRGHEAIRLARPS